MELKNFSSFSQLVNNTSRKERNNLFGTSLVYSSEYDIEAVAENVEQLIIHTKGYIEALEYAKGLIDQEKTTARQKKDVLRKLSERSLDELEKLIS